MKDPYAKADRGPGVPEAIPRALQRLWAEFGPEALDRVWIFPPMVSGRKESGLLAVSRYKDGEEGDRRVLSVLPYSAERTGSGLTLDASLDEHGEAPVDRLPRVMEGVVRRAESDLGEPREVEIGGSEERFLECLGTYARELLDPGLPPLSVPQEDPAPALAEPVAGGDQAGSVGPPTAHDAFDLYAPEAAP